MRKHILLLVSSILLLCFLVSYYLLTQFAFSNQQIHLSDATHVKTHYFHGERAYMNNLNNINERYFQMMKDSKDISEIGELQLAYAISFCDNLQEAMELDYLSFMNLQRIFIELINLEVLVVLSDESAGDYLVAYKSALESSKYLEESEKIFLTELMLKIFAK